MALKKRQICSWNLVKENNEKSASWCSQFSEKGQICYLYEKTEKRKRKKEIAWICKKCIKCVACIIINNVVNTTSRNRYQPLRPLWNCARPTVSSRIYFALFNLHSTCIHVWNFSKKCRTERTKRQKRSKTRYSARADYGELRLVIESLTD